MDNQTEVPALVFELARLGTMQLDPIEIAAIAVGVVFIILLVRSDTFVFGIGRGTAWQGREERTLHINFVPAGGG
jgi:hypothetical protein